MVSLIDKLRSQLEVWRLERRYVTKHAKRNRQSQYIYEDGHYISNPKLKDGPIVRAKEVTGTTKSKRRVFA
ncbi:hypothetical protein SAICODRAFT_16598 [Saitoella complicata NRRL Y-17804]|uniref:uncharacterized protein n=1 Tax=Saitoella complicata (strain BCRC 22490 / CBS 7301 / JCM 7358 / NBRC 10748 / NRRL Y-17804) TaxID=698492 RepID=UPI0008670C2C|nr:uncharacterized protein SAICODRAFT_16598 [Saitoella complicata NRRL Y-17804]ODQ56602.1 hypothetical protein SAICODRAFT_16598 [Saitoella complicata NRRL Y-17804]